MSVTFSTFNPEVIPWQDTVVDDIHCHYDYRTTHHEVLLSGAVGSAKTTLLAHEIVKHCLMYPKAHVMIGRRSLPDLKGTLYKAILDQLDQDDLRRIYKASDTRAIIKFSNGSLIRGLSWADRRYKKIRSYEFSMAAIEEGTENDEQDYELYKEAIMRLRHQVDIEAHAEKRDDNAHESTLAITRENYDPSYDEELGELILRPDISRGAPRLMIVATNPDSPAHWLYPHFITSTEPNRHVYYSLTSDNPFLPAGYLDDQLKSLDPKMAKRMLYGQWLDIRNEVIYEYYNESVHFLKDTEYNIDLRLPIKLTFDFNIGAGKPMSSVACQYSPHTDTFHGFDEAIIPGSRTLSQMEEWAGRGLFEHDTIFHIHGDATGAAQSTNSLLSNYQIIRDFLSNYRTKDKRSLRWELKVPLSNPPIMRRHNVMNAYFMNGLKQSRIRLYKRLKVSAKGFLLTALKKNASYIEDDSKDYQHVTTAWGYMVVWVENEKASVRGEVRKG